MAGEGIAAEVKGVEAGEEGEADREEAEKLLLEMLREWKKGRRT